MKKKKLKKINPLDIKKSNLFLPELCGDYKDIKNDAWFDIKKLTFMVSNLKKDNFILQKEKKILRAEQIKVNLTSYQKNMILKWIKYSRIIYNITVKYFRKNKLTSFINVRPIIKSLFYENFKNKIEKIPVHIIDNSIKDVLKSYKSSIALLKAGEIKKFMIRYKRQNKNKQ